MRLDCAVEVAGDVFCAHFNESAAGDGGAWSAAGCVVTRTNASAVQCACSHLTIFKSAVLRTVRHVRMTITSLPRNARHVERVRVLLVVLAMIYAASAAFLARDIFAMRRSKARDVL